MTIWPGQLIGGPGQDPLAFFSAVSAVKAGDVIAGKFQVERILGEGGMGYVVAARHMQLGQLVALKFMRDEVSTPEYKSRFLREARNTVRLRSKHVSRVLDVGTTDGGSPYMVMEYLEGADLSDLLHKNGPLPVQLACDYVIQACEAIAEAHSHGIVHRDLKPANLFLTRGSGGEDVVKVLDFGVSKVLELGLDGETNPGARSHNPDSVVTKATDLLGSPSYMAPEQIASARDADARSDIWSLGVILFRLISGKAPFSAQGLGEMIQAIAHGPIPNLRSLKPDLPHGLENVVARCLERDRTKRLGDVVELARILAPYAGPNATPSLERIAILGPALVTAPPPERIRRVTSPTNPSAIPVVSVSQAPPPPANAPWLANMLWIGLFLVVVGAAFAIALKIASSPVKDAASAPRAISASPPAPSLPDSAIPPPPPTSIVAAPTATIVTTAKPQKPSPRPRPKSSTAAAPSGGDIPSTRE